MIDPRETRIRKQRAEINRLLKHSSELKQELVEATTALEEQKAICNSQTSVIKSMRNELRAARKNHCSHDNEAAERLNALPGTMVVHRALQLKDPENVRPMVITSPPNARGIVQLDDGKSIIYASIYTLQLYKEREDVNLSIDPSAARAASEAKTYDKKSMTDLAQTVLAHIALFCGAILVAITYYAMVTHLLLT